MEPATSAPCSEDDLRPTPLEIASGVVVGAHHVRIDDSSSAGPLEAPLEALRRAIVPALRRPPCLVSFSGGVDSSFILAVATRIARAEGLPTPIACSWRVSGAPQADESVWQERIIADLRLPDWVKLGADDDLDLVGPVAGRLLRRHGVLHPVNVHLHLPIVEMAAGGSLLTGVGGDQILSGWRRARPASVSRSLKDALPSSLRARVRRWRGDDWFPWLRPRLARRVLVAHLHATGSEPRQFDRRVVWHASRRDLAVSCASLTVLADDNDVRLVNPLVDGRFVAALAQAIGRRPPLTRSDLLAAIAAGAVPPATYAARAKARFLEVFFRTPTRDFVSAWDGSGVDPRLVDVPALQRMWSSWPFPPGTAGLVQQAWLSMQPSAGSQSPLPGARVEGSR